MNSYPSQKVGDQAEKWSKLISNDPQVQQSFKQKTNIDDSPDYIMDLAQRFEHVMNLDPEFWGKLMFVVGAHLAIPDEDMEVLTDCADEADGISAIKESKLGKPLASYSADEIRQVCSRYNLMSLESFLRILNRINSASSGKLFQDQPQAKKV